MTQLPEYFSIEGKSKYFSLLERDGMHLVLSRETEIDTLLNTYAGRTDFIFRGLNNSRFKLYSSAQRFWITNDLDKIFSNYSEFIKNVINSTRAVNGETISRFLNAMNGKVDDLELLAFIQHYGGPTPLLDFSRNAEVALFFACQTDSKKYEQHEDIDNYLSLYVLSLNAFDEDGVERIFWNLMWNSVDKLRQNFSDADQEAFKKGIKNIDVFFDAFKSFRAVYVDTDIMKRFQFNLMASMNILNQQGIFFFLNDSSVPLEQIIHEDFGSGYTERSHSKWIKCFHVHKDLIPYILSKLSSVREDYIFPDPYNMIKTVISGISK